MCGVWCVVWKAIEKGANEKRSPPREEIQLGFYITDPPLDVRQNTCNFVMISDTSRIPLGDQQASRGEKNSYVLFYDIYRDTCRPKFEICGFEVSVEKMIVARTFYVIFECNECCGMLIVASGSRRRDKGTTKVTY